MRIMGTAIIFSLTATLALAEECKLSPFVKDMNQFSAVEIKGICLQRYSNRDKDFFSWTNTDWMEHPVGIDISKNSFQIRIFKQGETDKGKIFTGPSVLLWYTGLENEKQEIAVDWNETNGVANSQFYVASEESETTMAALREFSVAEEAFVEIGGVPQELSADTKNALAEIIEVWDNHKDELF